MATTIREISRHLRRHQAARIFAVNLYLQARVGGISRSEVREFARALAKAYEALKTSPTWAIYPSEDGRAVLVWRMCEDVASSPRFSFKPLLYCEPFDLMQMSEVLTVTTSQDFSAHCLDAAMYLRQVRVPTDIKTDHRTLELLLEHNARNVTGPAYLEPKTLKTSLKTATIRGRMPFFWISPPGVERTTLSAANLRDILGLVHIDNDNTWLLEISLSSAAVRHHVDSKAKADPHQTYLLRPRTLGSRPGTRFRAILPDEAKVLEMGTNWSPSKTGMTVNLESFGALNQNIDGWPELICHEAPWSNADLARREEWWGTYQPTVRIVGRIDAPARGGQRGIDDDVAYEAWLRRYYGGLLGLGEKGWKRLPDTLGMKA